MEMAQQYLREEELRARHQTALLKLRENALKEKTKAELALLKHQRMYANIACFVQHKNRLKCIIDL